MEGTIPTTEPTSPPEEQGEAIRLEALPKEIGVLLIAAGIGGVMLPGPVGAPFILMGGAVLFPRVFQGLERRFEKRFPKLHREGMRQVMRFVVDLERRYPSR